ncbi:MAG: sulfotransferase [Ardenticatenaceae bacterium]
MYRMMAAAFAVLTFFLSRRLSAANRAYLEMNENDWHINLLPKPSLFVRLFNIIVGKRGASLLITLLEKTAIESALSKSLKQMQEAEASGNVPRILCDAKARQAMRERLANYADDMRASVTLNAFAKVSNYSGSLLMLENHAGLLKLGMSAHEETVHQPVFIVSMPRTATTILHRTLATDTSRWRAFDLADMMQPLPPIPRSDRTARNKLASKVQKNLIDPIKWIYPGWFECLETMHSMVPNQVDEDLGIYDSGLGMTYQDTLMLLKEEQKARGMPLESTSLAKYRYAWLDMVMRIHQTLEPESDKTWLMKDPNHTAFLPQLLQQFPDARFIFTHRPPRDILASMAKLFLVFTCISVKPGAPGTTSAEWGQYALEKTKFFLHGVVQYTKENQMDESKRIDFLFSELAPDVVGSIERIYEMCFDTQPSEQVKAAMQAYLDDHKREKKGNQPRSLQDFHLTEHEVAFEEYSNIFLNY